MRRRRRNYNRYWLDTHRTDCGPWAILLFRSVVAHTTMTILCSQCVVIHVHRIRSKIIIVINIATIRKADPERRRAPLCISQARVVAKVFFIFCFIIFLVVPGRVTRQRRRSTLSPDHCPPPPSSSLRARRSVFNSERLFSNNLEHNYLSTILQ